VSPGSPVGSGDAEYRLAVVASIAPMDTDGERGAPGGGLRERKREKALQSIQDAALDLFIEKGFDATTVDEIAERAEVSRATFFRHFGSKGEVVFRRTSDGPLRASVLARPSSEGDLPAAVGAIREGWLPTLEPRAVERQTRAASTSPILRGLSYDLDRQLQATMSEALAERRGLKVPDHRCVMVSSIVFAAFSDAVNAWVHDRRGRGSLAACVDRSFATLEEVSLELAQHSDPAPRGPGRSSARRGAATGATLDPSPE
jgi:AcrR family transcriptional regulator